METQLSAMELEQKYGSFNYLPLPVELSRGEGTQVWDTQGQRYLDFVGGFSSVSQGHCHPRIVQAIQEQAARLTLVSRALYSDQFGPFAEYATRLFGYERVLLMNTGAEAFETAVKLARKWAYEIKGVPAGQAKVIVCEENFHGRTLGAMSASSNAKHHACFGPPLEGFVRIPFANLPALRAALADPSTAAFLVEPIQGEGGVRVPAEGYLHAAFAACRQANVLFIADEIQTGIGRTGRLLACQHEGVRPDVTLLGKALSGGTLPVSAVLADEPLLKLLQPGDHGSTFGGSPLACHVALVALRVIEDENLSERSAQMGQLFRAAVQELASPLVEEIRGRGLLNALVLRFGGSASLDQEFSLALLAEGLLVKAAKTNVFRFAPPLVIQEGEVREAVQVLGKVLQRFEGRVLS